MKMEGSPFLPLSEGLAIERVTPSLDELLVQVISSSLTACCPLCNAQAWRIHSRYTRQVADLPCAGQQITLRLTVRKFFCPNAACPRKIFAEQFPDLVASYARITHRLRKALVALGLATSAEVSERVAPELGMLVSAPTLLRRLRTVSCPPPTSVRILGVDDWGATRSYMCSCKDSRKEALT
jgi:zinc-finger of transposase IS204/IS1001/IS1096/IS1165